MKHGDETDPYVWLRSVCPTLEEGKKFMARWYRDGQLSPFDDEEEGPAHTIRAMAAHISLALEGKTFEECDEEQGDYPFVTCYMSTKYGSDLYFSFNEDPDLGE